MCDRACQPQTHQQEVFISVGEQEGPELRVPALGW
jgi:hypothetical protein